LVGSWKLESTVHSIFLVIKWRILVEDQEDLSYMVRKLKEEYELRGLLINEKM
jgi:hypothetical protein